MVVIKQSVEYRQCNLRKQTSIVEYMLKIKESRREKNVSENRYPQSTDYRFRPDYYRTGL